MNKKLLQKNILLKTFGCQMNEADSELVRTLLQKAGFTFIDDDTQADIILLNTCAVREHAVRRVRGAVHAIRHRRQGRPPALIGILGCVPTHLKEDLLRDKNLHVDLIAGPDSYRRLPALIKQIRSNRGPAADLTLNKSEMYEDIIPARRSGINAWIPIMRGCDNFCTFCVVPYTRGRERSRRPEMIVKEVRRAVRDGYPQVTLLGQNVNSYRFGKYDFAQLLSEISQIQGLRRIRFMSPHPKDFPDRLLAVMAAHDNICRHIHLPLQSGSTRILKKMNRAYSQRDYLSLVEKTREALTGVSLTTDIIVGFPGETETDFRATVKVMQTVKYHAAFIFKYSPRAGTLSAKKFKDDVPGDIKTGRIVHLNQLQKKISLAKNKKRIGQTVRVMIEGETAPRSRQQFTARADDHTVVIIPKGPYHLGDIIPVRIRDASAHVLKGHPVI